MLCHHGSTFWITKLVKVDFLFLAPLSAGASSKNIGPVSVPRADLETLADIAKTKSHRHLAAIATRPHLTEPVTDILVERGNSDLVRKIAANELATTIAARSDVPEEVQPFLKLALS